jgi:hypothetical protein
LKAPIGEENDQVDRCCLCLGRCNIGAGHVTRAASSAGEHDHRSPPSMRRGDAHGQRQMRDHIRPPARPPRSHPQLKNPRNPTRHGDLRRQTFVHRARPAIKTRRAHPIHGGGAQSSVRDARIVIAMHGLYRAASDFS